MADDRKHRLVQRLQRLAAVAIILILALLMIFLIGKRRERPRDEGVEEPVSSKKVDEKIRIHYVEFRGEREKVEFMADRAFIGPDDQYHLVGHVQIIDHGRKGGQRVVLSGEEVVHDADRLRYAFTGPVTILYRDMTVRTSHLSYDRQKEVFMTDRKVEVDSPRLRGQAGGLAYDLKAERLTLSGGLTFALISEEMGAPLVVSGSVFHFFRGQRKGSIENGVTLTHGRSLGTCQRLEFELFPRSDKLNLVYLKKSARLRLRSEFQGREGVSGAILKLGEDQDVEAEEIKLRAFQDSSLLHSYESKGSSSIRFYSSAGLQRFFQAERIDFVFDRRGGLREFRSFEGACLVQRDEKTGEERTVEGEAIILTGGSEWLQVRVPPGEKARAVMGKTEILADELKLGLESEGLEAREAKVVFAGQDRKQTVGLFEEKQPVFVTAGLMRYSREEGRFEFWEKARMWQDKRLLLADKLAFGEETGRASGSGGVRIFFPHKLKSRDREEKLEVSAQNLEYTPDTNKMVFEKEALLRLEQVEVKANSIHVQLDPETKQAERMTASGSVVVVQGLREGRGELAVYELEADQVILTGRPVLVEKDRGRIEGHKLTFHLADGTIAVENIGRERSVTLIKSNREQ